MGESVGNRSNRMRIMQDFRCNGRVSIWIGLTKPDPDQMQVDILKGMCGVEYYDIDFQSSYGHSKWKPLPVKRLIQPINYSKSFLTEAVASATAKGIETGVWVVCQFDFDYDPALAKQPIADDPVFIGSFPWQADDEEL